MCAMYDHPYRNWGFICVVDPDPAVDEPPAPGEGKVCSIDMEHTYACSDKHWNRCQMCPKSVCKAYPHIRAFVWLDRGSAVRNRFVCAYFCSKECLGEWASRGGDEE